MGVLDFDKTLRVDEYVNAFRQDSLQNPENEDLLLSTEFFQKKIHSNQNKTLMQVAIKTRKEDKDETKERLGICIVLDISGSMYTDHKHTDSIQALKNSLLELKEGNEFSLVLFNDSATIHIPPTRITNENRKKLVQRMEEVQFGGGTNIEDGLVLGYKAMSKFQNKNSRLILITDGVSNVGVTDPKDISKKAKVEFLKGSRISTVGLGYDVDEAVLRKIAQEGKGFYYFANDAKVLTKLLREDLTSLVKPAVFDVSLQLQANAGYNILDVYGYNEYKNKDKNYSIPIGELNVDDWRILIVEVEKFKTQTTNQEIPISVLLNFRKTPKGKKITQKIDPKIDWNYVGEKSEENINEKVARNSILFANAIALQEISKLYNQSQFENAKRITDTQLNNLVAYSQLYHTNELDSETERFHKVKEIILERTNPEIESLQERTPQNQQWKKVIKTAMQTVSLVQPGPWSVLLNLLAENI